MDASKRAVRFNPRTFWKAMRPCTVWLSNRPSTFPTSYFKMSRRRSIASTASPREPDRKVGPGAKGIVVVVVAADDGKLVVARIIVLAPAPVLVERTVVEVGVAVLGSGVSDDVGVDDEPAIEDDAAGRLVVGRLVVGGVVADVVGDVVANSVDEADSVAL